MITVNHFAVKFAVGVGYFSQKPALTVRSNPSALLYWPHIDLDECSPVAMSNQTNYYFFNLLILGLIISEAYRHNDRSQQRGLALGLAGVGLLTVLGLPHTTRFLKKEWLRVGAVVVMAILITFIGEVIWDEIRFKGVVIATLLIFGLLTSWTQGVWGRLPPIFWLFLSLGALLSSLTLGPKTADLGAYLGAWLWLAFNLGQGFKSQADS